MQYDLRSLMVQEDQAAAAALPESEIGVVVTAPGDGTAGVNCAGSTEIVTVAVGLALSPGDSVLVVRSRQRPVAVCRVPLAGSPTAAPDAPVAATPTTGSLFVPAAATWSTVQKSPYDETGVVGSTVDEVRQGSSDSGATRWAGLWAYRAFPDLGTLPKGAMPEAAVASGGSVKLTASMAGVPVAFRLWLGAIGTWPPQFGPILLSDMLARSATYGHAPEYLDVPLQPGETRWVDLPPSWIALLVNGYTFDPAYDAKGFGLALYSGDNTPYGALTGIADDPESGLLRIDWTL